VLALYAKGKPGGLIVVHEDDFGVVAAEFLAARDRGQVTSFSRGEVS
jgi:hypothetical protein